MTLYFLIILFLFAILDIHIRMIPNIAVLPAIAVGIYLTGNWLPALIMFSLGAFIYSKEIWRGGDVKLLTMIGAFIGYPAIAVLIVTFALIKLFRTLRDYRLALPVVPFMFVATIVTTGITGLLFIVLRIPAP